ncbi:MAG: hypothetical protein JSV52_03030 [Candidatus Zixiibacteriota bacterium]|nr:MAG: hypothetical protein JSV52_03030 [candidate division Zixibacteria bacterium]
MKRSDLLRNLAVRAFLYSSPILVALLIDVLVFGGPRYIPVVLYLPGFAIVLTISPTWETMHNVSPLLVALVSFAFYYCVVMLGILVGRRLKQHRASAA